jgi:hypothetical protein
MDDKVQLKGHWKIDLVEEISGKLLQSYEFDNVICNNGKERMSKMLNGVSSTYYRAIAVGTDATVASAAQTALLAEVARSTSAVLSYEADYKAKLYYEFSFGSNYTLAEAGVFDSETVSGSTILNRVVLSPTLAVSSSVKAQITATISIA